MEKMAMEMMMTMCMDEMMCKMNTMKTCMEKMSGMDGMSMKDMNMDMDMMMKKMQECDEMMTSCMSMMRKEMEMSK
ncbi:hypothetical protein [Saccharibacillus sacchari]|uniref:hypothetical protein n=1 Tax=Saccharibacillus sacchari TaxID=456493 RepID=UPI0004B70093|nr:hypothetical protein [Saccharibacillus sacchari]